ncbi:hypothetical protein ACFL4V_02665, partial [Candidatus Latescibacterota bacterium]
MTEALAKVRDELGSDAIILNTRSNRKGGVFDFVGRSFVEVTAAIDEKPLDKKGNGSAYMRRSSSPISPSDARLYPPERPVSYEPSNVKRSGDVRVKSLGDRVNIEEVVDDIKELRRSVKVLADSALTSEMTG